MKSGTIKMQICTHIRADLLCSKGKVLIGVFVLKYNFIAGADYIWMQPQASGVLHHIMSLRRMLDHKIDSDSVQLSSNQFSYTWLIPRLGDYFVAAGCIKHKCTNIKYSKYISYNSLKSMWKYKVWKKKEFSHSSSVAAYPALTADPSYFRA